MGFKPQKRKKFEDTIIGQSVNSIASQKTRQNIYIQNSKSSNGHNKVIQEKSLSLYSARVDAGMLIH
ncbi:hypothetical protein [Poseidonibacter lekithochrous]|uniref:hypothetical protein n=1 Tax=Poseidonibacter lekithochrous TaxID=1904463 RepID=UPI0008FC6984|nr:hypothetical protein [Poseidonibacter lekithochrous]QKJ21525.1 hypothetical protein ALEK_0205 [Poseidonibacter lekithochrous]